MYVCLCHALTDREVRAKAAHSGASLATVYRNLGVRPKCGKCVPFVRAIVDESNRIPRRNLGAGAS